jgi:hypothetical protein
MGRQKVTGAFADVLNIISSTTANTLADNATNYSSDDIIIESNTNSRHCRNFAFVNNSTQYYVSSQIFSSVSTTQSLIIDILQQLSDQQNLNKDGWAPGSQNAQFFAAIKDKLESTLTSDNLVNIGQNASNVDVGVETCTGSVGGINVIIARNHQIFRYYNNLYAQNTAIQSLAADISNYISGTQSVKATGLLVVIIRMIALIVIVICIVIGLGVVATIVISIKF